MAPDVAPYFSLDGGTNGLVYFNQYPGGTLETGGMGIPLRNRKETLHLKCRMLMAPPGRPQIWAPTS